LILTSIYVTIIISKFSVTIASNITVWCYFTSIYCECCFLQQSEILLFLTS